MRFRNFLEISRYVEDLGLFHMDLSLERVERFAQAFGPVKFVVAHVAGTNGKGSTAAFLERLAREHGLRTGLSTSPHFLDIRERVLVDGEPLSEEAWVAAANQVDELAGDADLTYFEFLTCLAMSAFQRAGVRLAVMEAGLGGRYDAVRAFGADMAVMTHIGLDHMHVLGPTLEYIARDKAHIIRKDTPAFTCIQDARVLEVLTERAQSVGATLDVAQPFTGRVGMRGRHQRSNAGLALLAWRRLAEMLCVSVDGRKVERALAEAFVPGRLQVVEQEGAVWYLDGAHNEPALLALGRALRDEGLSPETLVVSCMRDKDLERMAPLLRELCPGQILCPDLPWYERMLPGPELARILGERASSALSPVQGFERAAQGKGPILVCGSLYLLAEFYRLYPQHLSRSTS